MRVKADRVVADLVEKNDLIYFIVDVVAELDISAITAKYEQGGGRGHPPYHPRMMVTLLLYAYCRGVFSSRRIMHACQERATFRVIVQEDVPDFQTMNVSPSTCSAAFGSSDLTMTDCILWDGGDEISNNDGSTVTVTYTNVEGGFPGIGNIDADPLFIDPDNGDYRLSSGSPCIDAGDNTAVPEDITTDLDGNPRFLDIPETPDTGNGTLPIVDMGAYESLGGGCLAVTSQEVVCHADGTTFTVNVEGLNACTGGTTQVTFTASGGAVGQELCFTALVNDGGFCCSTEICVTIPTARLRATSTVTASSAWWTSLPCSLHGVHVQTAAPARQTSTGTAWSASSTC